MTKMRLGVSGCNLHYLQEMVPVKGTVLTMKCNTWGPLVQPIVNDKWNMILWFLWAEGVDLRAKCST